MITILEASEQANISKDKCRYWLKLLKQDTVKKSGKLYLPDNVVALLKNMKKSIETGLQPVTAANEIKTTFVKSIIPEQKPNQTDNTQLLQKISDLEKSILLMAKMLEQQNKQINKISIQLKPQATKQIEVWKPTEPKRPQYSTIQRIWYEVTNPAKLRAN